MRIKVTRECVIDKLNLLERSPQRKTIPKLMRLRSKSTTPERKRTTSPKKHDSHFISPRSRSDVKSRIKKKTRAVNLKKLFNETSSNKSCQTNSKERKSDDEMLPCSNHTNCCKLVSLSNDGSSDKTISNFYLEDKNGIGYSNEALDPQTEGCVISLVSMKTEVDTSTPPPVKIKRKWKKKLPICSAYKLFGPDSPAKTQQSPHHLALKLCFLPSLDSPDRCVALFQITVGTSISPALTAIQP